MIHIDAKSVFFVSLRISVARLPQEQFLVGHLLWLRDMLQIGVCKCVRWVDTRDMAADGMTKGALPRDRLFDCMAGHCELVHEYEHHPQHSVRILLSTMTA